MTINKILDELKLYIAKDKQIIFYKAIQDRLDKCLVEYYNSIRKAYEKLPASVVRWYETACGDRHCSGLQSRSADL